jgi:hypothetical protein
LIETTARSSTCTARHTRTMRIIVAKTPFWVHRLIQWCNEPPVVMVKLASITALVTATSFFISFG